MASIKNRGGRKLIPVEKTARLSGQILSEAELARRQSLLRQVLEIQRMSNGNAVRLSSSEEMQREDRSR